MKTVKEERTEEEIEEFRLKRIEHYTWIMKNIEDVKSNIENNGDPDGLRSMLLEKLRKELREFIHG